MIVKPCPHSSQICDVFSISDQSEYTSLNPDSTKGFFREQVFFSNHMNDGIYDLKGKKTT